MKYLKKWWWLFLIVGILWLSPLLIFKFFYKYNFEEKGQIGDSFGVITSLFSGLGFVGLLITINQQQKEIENQNRRSEQQDKLTNEQRFSDTFFKLIDLHHSIINQLRLRKFSSDKYVIGREVLNLFITLHNSGIKNRYDQYVKYKNSEYYDTPPESNEIKDIVDVYKIYGTEMINPSAFKMGKEDVLLHTTHEFQYLYYQNLYEFHNHLSNYFRNLYHILKFIHLAKDIPDDRKKFYSNILRSQLSNSELLSLFYNNMSRGNGYPNCNYLCYHYRILENLNRGSIVFPIHQTFHWVLQVKEDPFVELKED